LLINVATWGALAVELSLGVLVWNRRLRLWVLLAGVLMHTSIMLTMAVGYFTPAMFVLYLVFVPPETVKALPSRLRSRSTLMSPESPPPESIDTAETSPPPAIPAPRHLLPSTPGTS
jgi:hypothetical protein